MKRILAKTLVLTTLAACSGEGLLPDKPDNTVSVSFRLGDLPEIDVETKASNPAIDDSKVNSTVLMIFKNKQDRVLYQTSPDRAYPLLEVPGNCELDIFAIVNPSNDFSSVTTYKAFQSMTSTFDYKKTQDFEMVAHLDTVLKVDCNVVLKVQRIAAKLSISSIKYRQHACDNVDGHFLERIRLNDIASSCPYTLDNFSPKRYFDGSTQNKLSSIDIAQYTPIRTREGGYEYYEFNAGYTLYCYPNTSPIHTKVELKLTGWGMTNEICAHYYAFRLPELLPNKNYVINKLNITTAPFSDDYDEYYYYPLSLNINYDMDVYDAVSGEYESSFKGKEVGNAEFSY